MTHRIGDHLGNKWSYNPGDCGKGVGDAHEDPGVARSDVEVIAVETGRSEGHRTNGEGEVDDEHD